MISVEMPRDVREFEPKVIAGFTTRQLICIGALCLYDIPIALLLPGDIMIKLIVAIILAVPAVLCGWVKLFGMPFEKFLLQILIPTMFNPSIRRYRTENAFDALRLPEDASKDAEHTSVKYSREYRPYK
ncbi:MAG: PrgI family protein [Eubacteriales bacterium]|nr:PrgI family protein [Eubacteriales bacterium]